MISKLLDIAPIKTLYDTYSDFTSYLYHKNINIYDLNYLFNIYKYLFEYSLNFKYHKYSLKEQKDIVKKYDHFKNEQVPINDLLSKQGYFLYELNQKYDLFKKSKSVLEITNKEILSDAIYYINQDLIFNLLSYKGSFSDENMTMYNTIIFESNIINEFEDKKYDIILIGEIYPDNHNDVGILWEECRYRSLIYNIYHSLVRLNKGGNMIVNLVECKTDFTLSLIYYLSSFFNDLNLEVSKIRLVSIKRVKYNYLICRNYNKKSPDRLKELIKKYKINKDSFDVTFSDEYKDYYKNIYTKELDKGYIKIINNDKYITGKNNFPNIIIPLDKSRELSKVIQMIDNHNRKRSESHLKILKFIRKNYKYMNNKKYMDEYNKMAKFMSIKYCKKYGIDTRNHEMIAPDLTILDKH